MQLLYMAIYSDKNGVNNCYSLSKVIESFLLDDCQWK